ncbi:MAG: C40 family peptidase [Chitinophagaceae bacterium]
MKFWLFTLSLLVIINCSSCFWFIERPVVADKATSEDSVVGDTVMVAVDSFTADNTQNIDTPIVTPPGTINTGNIHPEAVMSFAETLIGTPYVYASTNPNVGFDCSGFITYVFNHFNIKVPRSSVDFTNVGKTIPVTEAKRGDIILFTGTNPEERHVGHMGLIVSNKPISQDSTDLKFIHSSSGKAMGVTITPFNKGFYQRRFVKTIRLFPQNDYHTL